MSNQLSPKNPCAPGRLVVCNPAIVAHFCSLHKRSDDTRDVAAPAVHRFLLIAGIGFVFCPTSGRYWRKSLSAIVLLLSSLASIFAFLVQRSRVCPRLKSGLPRSAELPSVIVPTFGASQYFDKSLPFAAATESRTTGAIAFLAPIAAMTSPRRRPQRASPSCFRIRIFKEPQRPEATLAQFKYATSPGRSCRLGRLESGFCDSPSGL